MSQAVRYLQWWGVLCFFHAACLINRHPSAAENLRSQPPPRTPTTGVLHVPRRCCTDVHVGVAMAIPLPAVPDACVGEGSARMPSYRDVVVLAPMVRCGTLPLRLLALRHGADLVWSEELIAWRLAKCLRRVDPRNGFVYFDNPPRSANGAPDKDIPVYVTAPEERGRNILQLGAADGASAVAAARVVVDDVAGVDVNMGCPKPFSLQGGMGAALLKDRERASDIVKSLSRNFGSTIGVTCKIRLLPTVKDTCDFVLAMIASGAQAVTIHARLPSEKPTDFAHWEVLREVISSAAPSVPIIANGDAFSPSDVDVLKNSTGAASVMIARGALANASVFNAIEGKELLHPSAAIAQYIALAEEIDNGFSNTKYTVQTMVKEGGFVSDDDMFRAKTYAALSDWCRDWCARIAAGGVGRSSRLKSAWSVGVAPAPLGLPRAAGAEELACSGSTGQDGTSREAWDDAGAEPRATKRRRCEEGGVDGDADSESRAGT